MANEIPSVSVTQYKNATHYEYGSTTKEVEEEDTEEEDTENGSNTPGGTLKPDPDAPGEGNGENEDEYTPPDNDGGFRK